MAILIREGFFNLNPFLAEVRVPDEFMYLSICKVLMKYPMTQDVRLLSFNFQKNDSQVSMRA
ncbi:hypothetical protein ACGAPV_001943 [Morganella morganii]